MQMRNSIQWRDKDLSDGYYGTEAQVAKEVVLGVINMTVQIV